MRISGIIFRLLVLALLLPAQGAFALETPAAPAPAAAPPAPPPPPSRPPLPLLNEQPMQDYTKYFPRREFSLEAGRESFAISYFFRQPDNPGENQSYPLVVILHDDKGLAPAALFLLSAEMRKKFPAFIAVPALPRGKIWAFPKELPDYPALSSYLRMPQALADVAELVRDLREDHPIDRDRIYIVGCSIGGFGAFAAARQYPDLFAGAVAINGGWTANEAPQMTKLPLFVMHGVQNTLFPIALSQNTAYYIQKNGGKKVQFLPFPGLGNDCASPLLYSPVMWQWLFRQHR